MTKRRKDLYRKERRRERERRKHDHGQFLKGMANKVDSMAAGLFGLTSWKPVLETKPFNLEEALVLVAERMAQWNQKWIEELGQEKVVYVSHAKYQQYVQMGLIDKEGRWQ